MILEETTVQIKKLYKNPLISVTDRKLPIQYKTANTAIGILQILDS